MLLDVGYVVENVDPPYEKCVVFLVILAVARMVIWTTRKKGLYDGANFSHRDLILFFRHQLRVKIRCDRKRLDRITFDKRWMYAVSLVVRKLESSLPPLPAHGDDDSSGPHPVSSFFIHPFCPLVSFCLDVCHWPRHLVIRFQDLSLPQFFLSPRPSSSTPFF